MFLVEKQASMMPNHLIHIELYLVIEKLIFISVRGNFFRFYHVTSEHRLP